MVKECRNIEEEFRSQNGLIAPLSLTGVRINTSLREAAPTTGSVQVSRGFRPATDSAAVASPRTLTEKQATLLASVCDTLRERRERLDPNLVGS
ncbi:hypothetical protein [Nostoc sp.]|uniref:hypothetical protein n=1 Tax=Nostoc sp. TaxID=1180 RepID=UPI00359351C8